MEQTNNPFGDAIYCYTRKQAIVEGVLVDLSQTDAGRQHWKYPVACTAAVWTIVESAINHEGQDLEGILHDLFTMAKIPGTAESPIQKDDGNASGSSIVPSRRVTI